MTVAIIGGLKRLEREYKVLGLEEHVDVRIFNSCCPALTKRVALVDGVVIFTDTVSHRAVREVGRVAKKRGLPIVRGHGPGLATARRCLKEARLKAARK